jgi:hypothetical protein
VLPWGCLKGEFALGGRQWPGALIGGSGGRRPLPILIFVSLEGGWRPVALD